MRALAGRLGIRAPSLYKHFPDKSAVEAEVIALAMRDLARALEAAQKTARETARETARGGLGAPAGAYRAYALAHPHLYRLMTDRPLPRADLPPGLEERTAAPLQRATGSPARAPTMSGIMEFMPPHSIGMVASARRPR